MDSTGRPPASGDGSGETPDGRSDDLADSSSELMGPSEPSVPSDEPTRIIEPLQASHHQTYQSASSISPDEYASTLDIPNEFESRASLEDIPTQVSAFDEQPGIIHTQDRSTDRNTLQGNVADWSGADHPDARHYVAMPPNPHRFLMARRRRRYIFYMRHSARARHAAHSTALTRLAWASAIITAAVIATLLTGSFGVASSYYQSQQAAVDSLNRTIASRDSVRIYDRKGVLLYQFSDNGAQHSISLAHVPLQLVNATIAIEDRSFWINQGVDFTSIVRAGVADIQTRSINQGGSTITQQLIKQNVLNSNETFDRKLREAILAIGMTATGAYTKSQILEMYLNSIPYGQEAYGIDAAAAAYFGYQDDPVTGETAAQHLDLAQASMLAGIPQNPNTNNPLLHPQHARDRQTQVLQAMVTEGYITPGEMKAALAESASPNFFHPQPNTKNLAPHFVDFVRQQLEEMVQTGQIHLTRSGLNVYTTLDIDLQNYVQQAMKDHLYGNNRDDYGGYIRNDHLTNLAGMLVQHRTGAIMMMLGSVDYYSTTIDGQFNVLTSGPGRGPGSSFKPIVYAAAFAKGWFPGMTIADMPTVFWDSGRNQPWNPLDFNYNQFWGNITLRTALQNSLNIPAVKVMQFAGVDDVRNLAMRMGVTYWPSSARWGLSSALGTLDVHPYELVQAYTVFANYGQYIPLYAIDKITDSSGDTLFQYTQPRPIQVMSPQVAFLVTNVLSDNFTRAKDFGACSPLFLDTTLKGGDCQAWLRQRPPADPTGQATWPSPNAWPAAAKTGTGNDFEDDWTLGYTMDFTGGFWGGNNDHTAMYHIDGITGAAPIWRKAMLYAEQEYGLPKTPFPVPNGVHQITYTSNGITSTDWILDGVIPPADIGNAGPLQLPCITFTDNPNNPWVYSNGPCQGSLIPGGGSPYRP
ncbi:MAG TPA: transglycosylase domain-containing protein [Ktedonobacterales bacterium]